MHAMRLTMPRPAPKNWGTSATSWRRATHRPCSTSARHVTVRMKRAIVQNGRTTQRRARTTEQQTRTFALPIPMTPLPFEVRGMSSSIGWLLRGIAPPPLLMKKVHRMIATPLKPPNEHHRGAKPVLNRRQFDAEMQRAIRARTRAVQLCAAANACCKAAAELRASSPGRTPLVALEFEPPRAKAEHAVDCVPPS